jgi:uncharacterized protein
MFEHTILREESEKILCLSVKHSTIFEAKKRLWKEYLQNKNKSYLWKCFYQLGLFENPDTTPELSIARDYTNLIINLTTNCNFDCVYCFREKDHKQSMKMDTFKQSIDLIPKYFNQEKSNITFFGGEPLLLFGRISSMVSYAKAKLQGRRLSFSITTNGSLLNPKVIDFLVENNFDVTVSLDSFAQVNFLSRKPLIGDPFVIYSYTLKNIQCMISRGIIVACNIVVTENNVDSLFDFICFLKELGLSKTSISFVASAKFPFTPSLSSRILTQEKFIIDNLLNDPSFTVEPISTLINNIRSHKLNLYKCGYGRLRINIQPNGEITPCQRVYHQIGTVSEGINPDMSVTLALESVDNRPACHLCPFRYLCGGNCYHESMTFEGDLHKPYMPICQHFANRVRIIAEKILKECEPMASIDGLTVI